MMGYFLRELSSILNLFPLDFIVRVFVKTVETIQIKTPHIVKCTFFEISTSMDIVAIIVNNARISTISL